MWAQPLTPKPQTPNLPVRPPSCPPTLSTHLQGTGVHDDFFAAGHVNHRRILDGTFFLKSFFFSYTFSLYSALSTMHTWYPFRCVFTVSPFSFGLVPSFPNLSYARMRAQTLARTHPQTQHMCVCVYLYIYIYIYTYIKREKDKSIDRQSYIFMFMYTYTHIRMYIYNVSAYIFTYTTIVHVCLCIYTHIYTYCIWTYNTHVGEVCWALLCFKV
jgi:hypothetical protein